MSVVKRFLRRTGFWSLMVVCALAGTAAAGLAFVAVAGWRALPSYDGVRTVAGLQEPVEIWRDGRGIAHIWAESEADAAFALGYVHAQDRLWQMEILRRAGQGRLAEVFGRPALPVDRLMRTLGLYRLAQETVQATPADAPGRGVLDAYAAGVNAWLEHRDRPLPLEFQALWHTPEPWREADSIVVLKVMAAMLSGNAASELSRAALAGTLPRRVLAEFFPPYPGDPPLPLPDALTLERLVQGFARSGLAGLAPLLPDPDLAPASNNWVVSGQRSVTGKPLLANDPHLGMWAPSFWFLAHLDSPENAMVGATLPGVPNVVLGRNRRLAWGFTNTRPDTQDVYLERLAPGDPDSYLTPEGTAAFDTRKEVINVRFGAPQTQVVRQSRHGPVLDGLPGGLLPGGGIPEGHVLALAWTGFTADDTTAQAGYGLARAHDWDSFNAALRDYVTPMQSMVYADVDGNIGLIAPGLVPVRGPDHETAGLMPARGWLARNDWQGMIPYEDLPRRFNPPGGAIATANHKIVDDDYPHHLTYEWDAPRRAARADQMLAARPLHSVESFEDMQQDTLNLFAVELLPLLLETEPGDVRAHTALDMLAGWDGRMTGSAAQPLIYAAWLRELVRAISADELRQHFRAAWRVRPAFLLNVLRNADSAGRWCGNALDESEINSDSTGLCADILAQSLSTAMTDLAAEYGADMSAWRWDEAHLLINRHLPGGVLPGPGGWLNVERPSAGGIHTLNRGQYRMASAQPFANVHAAGMRAIYDLSDPDGSWFTLSTGQAGSALAAGYDATADGWIAGEYFAIPMRRNTALAQRQHRLRLQPS